jgi:hypothetical protein
MFAGGFMISFCCNGYAGFSQYSFAVIVIFGGYTILVMILYTSDNCKQLHELANPNPTHNH